MRAVVGQGNDVPQHAKGQLESEYWHDKTMCGEDELVSLNHGHKLTGEAMHITGPSGRKVVAIGDGKAAT